MFALCTRSNGAFHWSHLIAVWIGLACFHKHRLLLEGAEGIGAFKGGRRDTGKSGVAAEGQKSLQEFPSNPTYVQHTQINPRFKTDLPALENTIQRVNWRGMMHFCFSLKPETKFEQKKVLFNPRKSIWLQFQEALSRHIFLHKNQEQQLLYSAHPRDNWGHFLKWGRVDWSGLNLRKRFIFANPECAAHLMPGSTHSLWWWLVLFYMGDAAGPWADPRPPQQLRGWCKKLLVRGNRPLGAGCCGIVRPEEKLFAQTFAGAGSQDLSLAG